MIQGRSGIHVPRLPRFFVVWGPYIVIFAASAVGAFLLRFEFELGLTQLENLVYGLCFWLPIYILAFTAFHINRTWRRHTGLPDLLMLGSAVLCSTVASAVLIQISRPSFPRSVHI